MKNKKSRWALIILLIAAVLFGVLNDKDDELDNHVAGLRSFVGEEVVSIPLESGREERIYLNDETIIDIHRIDVQEENRVLSTIDFAAEFFTTKDKKKIAVQQPFFRQIIEFEYEILSDTQIQIKNFIVDCVPGSEMANINENNIILPEKQVYEIGEPILWEMYIYFENGSYGIWDRMNLNCSITINEHGNAVYAISRDVSDSSYWTAMQPEE